ncbi:MAG: cyclic nucleotide-binding domain-containing protein [Gammaproteobacteria bacterium]
MEYTPQITILKKLIPICELTDDNFRELVRQIQLETLPAGETLFRRGDTDQNTFYLINGEVALIDGNGDEKSLNHRSTQCRFPLDHHRPRHYTLIARTEIRYLRIDNNLLDVLLTWDQNAGYVVQELGDEERDADEHDWMSKILQSKIFYNVPAANIQTMFIKMQAIPVRKDEIIMKQGEAGDDYYMIKDGRCAVIRNAVETGNKPMQIAELASGEGFGEEALIAAAPRNATIKMLTDGVLMRLSREDFDQLLKAPVLSSLDYAAALERVQAGAVWLDVRLVSEHQHQKIPGSLNIPLFLLRLNANKLMKNKHYIVYCDTGRRSASAAFILRERGIDCFILEGGLQNIPAESIA